MCVCAHVHVCVCVCICLSGIANRCCYFYGEEPLGDPNFTKVLPWDDEASLFSWEHAEVLELHQRRYMLKSNALEIFLSTGRTVLLAFDSTKVGWNSTHMHHIPSHTSTYHIHAHTSHITSYTTPCAPYGLNFDSRRGMMSPRSCASRHILSICRMGGMQMVTS